MVIDAEVDPALILFTVRAEELFIGDVYADDRPGLKALFRYALGQELKILRKVRIYHPRVFPELPERETKSEAAAESVAVGIGVGEDLKIIM